MRRAAAIADAPAMRASSREGVLVSRGRRVRRGAPPRRWRPSPRPAARPRRRDPALLAVPVAQEVLDTADVAVALRAHLGAEVHDLLLLVVAQQRIDLGADLRVEERAVALDLREVRGARANRPLVDGVRQDRVVERPAGVLSRLQLRLDLGGVRPEDRLDLRLLIVGQVEGLGDAREARRPEAPGRARMPARRRRGDGPRRVRPRRRRRRRPEPGSSGESAGCSWGWFPSRTPLQNAKRRLNITLRGRGPSGGLNCPRGALVTSSESLPGRALTASTTTGS